MSHLRRLRDRYERALDEAKERRAAYHEAIRAAYVKGRPLRELAQELGLSHQRVHQIVADHGPSGQAPTAQRTQLEPREG